MSEDILKENPGEWIELEAKNIMTPDPKETMEEESELDWTRDRSGRSNSSDSYLDCVHEVKYIILSGADDLLSGRIDNVARCIVSRLAHTGVGNIRLAPKPRRKP